MAKATRASENTTPKKRTRKAAVNSEATNGNGTNGNGTEVAEVVTASPATVEEAQVMPILEEKIRVRAYELYLQRHGQHGSPEQDWLQAAQEICGQRSA
jgi:hypothetical protein